MPKISELIVELGAKTDKLSSGLNKGKSDILGFNSAINKIGGAIAGAFAVSRIAAFSMEVSKLAAQAEGVGLAFKRIDTGGMLNELRKATKGTVSDLDLMKAAVQANNFDIPLKQLGRLLEFAHQRAKDTGQSVDYLVQSIVLGIGRKSPLILDNLGISAVKLREKLKGAGTEMSTVGDVAKVVGDIAEEELKKIGATGITTADAFAQLKTKWNNFKVSIGKEVNEKFIDIANAVIRTRNAFVDLYNTSLMFRRYINGLGANFQLLFNEVILAFNIAVTSLETIFKLSSALFKKELASIPDIIGEMYKKQVKNFKDFGVDTYNAYKKAFDKAQEDKPLELMPEISITNEKINPFSQDFEDDAESLTGLIPKLTKQIEDLEKKSKETFDPALISKYNDEIARLNVQLENLKQGVNIKDDDLFFRRRNARDLADFQEQVGNVNHELGLTKDNAEQVNFKHKIEEALTPSEKLKDNFEILGKELINVAANSDSMKEFANNAISSSKQVIAAYIAEGVAGAVKNALAGVPFPFNLVAAGIAGGAAAALFNSVIPSFANEGMVNRPTLAMVGDYAGANTNPEFMLKKSTLEKMGNGSQRIEIYGTLSNRTIYLSNKNYGEYLQRTT